MTPAEIAANLPEKVVRRIRMIARREHGMPMDKRAANGLVRRGLCRRQLDDYCRTEWNRVVARLAVVYLTDLGRAVAAELETP